MLRAGNGRRVVVAALALLTLFALAAPAADARRRVPFGFLGMHADQGMADPRVDHAAEIKLMARSGVESVRFVINWNSAQRYPNFASVPPTQRARLTDVGGVPTDFTASDTMMQSLARYRLEPIVVIVYTPPWARQIPSLYYSPPRNSADFGRFAAALVRRYGPRGTFWKGRRGRPVRKWQIWNEPARTDYWPVRNFAPGYVPLLRSAYRSIKHRDRRAEVILTGLAATPYVKPWTSLGQIYRAGGRRYFDAVALHQYSQDPYNLSLSLKAMRREMARRGDRRKPLLLTEFGWAAGKGRTRATVPWNTTPAGQARELRGALNMLVANRRRFRLQAVSWFTWVNGPATFEDWGTWSGLRYVVGAPGANGFFRVRSRPALATFTRSARHLEGCRKRSLATDC